MPAYLFLLKQSKDFHGFTFTSSLVGVSLLLNYISLYCHEISNYVIMTEQHELALTIQGGIFRGNKLHEFRVSKGLCTENK